MTERSVEITADRSDALAEWRSHAMLPVSAMIGASMGALPTYGAMPYLLEVTGEFDWTREQFSGAVSILPLLGAICGVGVGMAVDRFGSRVLGLIGIVSLCCAFALLSTATGSLTNWYLLWGIISLCALPTAWTVWVTPVAGQFKASRGLAFALVLTGNPLGQTVFPPLATKLIALYGWRTAILIQGLGWMALCLPVVFFFFLRNSNGPIKREQALTGGMSILAGLRSTVYLRLLLTAFLFTFSVIPLVYHFIPIAKDHGLTAQSGAWLASLLGLSSIIGRVLTGLSLDRFPAKQVGIMAFAFAVLAALVLLFGGNNFTLMIAAAVFIGLAMGAETDVIAYLTASNFGLRSLGTLNGGIVTALAAGVATGPLVASRIFDRTQDYTGFLWLVIGLVLVAAMLLASMPNRTGQPDEVSVI